MSDLADRLTAALDRRRPERVIGKRLRWKTETGSTNDDCHAAELAGESPGLAMLADLQTAGRGQHGRTWRAPAGLGVLLSILVPNPKRGPAFLTAWGSVAVAECLTRSFGLAPTVKWPNDVLVGGKKIAGVLAESRRAEVLGVGLNVLQKHADFPPDCVTPPTSIVLETVRPVDRIDVATELLATLDELWSAPSDDLFDRWGQYSQVRPGDEVVATLRTDVVGGVLVELRPDRGLRLRTADGEFHEGGAGVVRVEKREESSPRR